MLIADRDCFSTNGCCHNWFLIYHLVFHYSLISSRDWSKVIESILEKAWRGCLIWSSNLTTNLHVRPSSDIPLNKTASFWNYARDTSNLPYCKFCVHSSWVNTLQNLFVGHFLFTQLWIYPFHLDDKCSNHSNIMGRELLQLPTSLLRLHLTSTFSIHSFMFAKNNLL